ncbi:MAG TPA: GxxExxY protein [Nitrospirota bacterium]|nr:GxxExxY protein [Nitrospirota bacterium]
MEIERVAEKIVNPEAQLLTYLKIRKCKLGFLLDWNVLRMKDGIKRMVNNL